MLLVVFKLPFEFAATCKHGHSTTMALALYPRALELVAPLVPVLAESMLPTVGILANKDLPIGPRICPFSIHLTFAEGTLVSVAVVKHRAVASIDVGQRRVAHGRPV